MSKEKTAAKGKGATAAKDEAKKKAPPIVKAADLYKYTVETLAADTGLQQSSIRVGLRASPFKREASAWGWNNKKEYDEVVAYFKERAGRKPDVTSKKDKPAKTKPVAPAVKGKKKAA